ncbi:acetyl-CoA carboxylase biotin carboxyl carrier protein [Aquirhabdus parva]|uniref:Biotin carboxyl carrier protein of acetyl-CoA carboxylase n=1 Tax=Aquirhabdus parva TaxID=2283318 RepID=A0A345P5K7_9GAMM|nr:acetyl-CoA carboxylase biotin carboxyl carrier protein [Aquirhabdus parva]AXI02566.1 acetyl-CoA carboxylase biotin carboxyl carrier protein [Aquirhabdus parva]
MDIRKIKKLIDLMIESDLEAIEVKEGDQSIALTRRRVVSTTESYAPASAPLKINTDVSPAPNSGRLETSPMVGVYYAAPNPGEPAFIKVGQKIQAGDTIGIVEAMKIMNPIQASQSGTVAEILVKNGDVVQFGQSLIRLQD